MLSPVGLGGVCFPKIGKRSQWKEEVKRKSCDLCVWPDHKGTAVQRFIESGLECVFGAEQVLLSKGEEEGRTTNVTLLTLIMSTHTLRAQWRTYLFQNKSSFHKKFTCTHLTICSTWATCLLYQLFLSYIYRCIRVTVECGDSNEFTKKRKSPIKTRGNRRKLSLPTV